MSVWLCLNSFIQFFPSYCIVKLPIIWWSMINFQFLRRKKLHIFFKWDIERIQIKTNESDSNCVIISLVSHIWAFHLMRWYAFGLNSHTHTNINETLYFFYGLVSWYRRPYRFGLIQGVRDDICTHFFYTFGMTYQFKTVNAYRITDRSKLSMG